MFLLRPLAPLLLLTLLLAPAAYAQPESDIDPEYDAFDLQGRSRPRFDRAELSRLMRYPEVARNDTLQGRVVVGVLIDTSGRVMNSRIEYSTHTIFEKTALTTIENLKFRPGRIYGRPVRVWLSIPLDYTLPWLGSESVGATTSE